MTQRLARIDQDTMHTRITRWLLDMHDREASDLHLVAGYPPMYRVHGQLTPADETVVAPDEPLQMVRAIAPPRIAAQLDTATDLDFATQLDHAGQARRFRVNLFSSRGQRGACFRSIPDTIPTLPELAFPAELAQRLTNLRNGLVLVTGITGSGKTSTLAALIQLLNQRGGSRIITIEEPIEYVYPAAPGSLVTQREVGADVATFYDGLRFGLRQDPDVILVGEIRDRDTAQLALSAAETGHLIFATLHTTDAKGSITRLVDLFPSERHDDIRTQLSLSLRYVVTQHLLPTGSGGRRLLALEVLCASFPVRAAIRQGKIESLDTAIQSGRKEGMFTLDQYLRQLVEDRLISLDVARQYAKDPKEFG